MRWALCQLVPPVTRDIEFTNIPSSHDHRRQTCASALLQASSDGGTSRAPPPCNVLDAEGSQDCGRHRHVSLMKSMKSCTEIFDLFAKGSCNGRAKEEFDEATQHYSRALEWGQKSDHLSLSKQSALYLARAQSHLRAGMASGWSNHGIYFLWTTAVLSVRL